MIELFFVQLVAESSKIFQTLVQIIQKKSQQCEEIYRKSI